MTLIFGFDFTVTLFWIIDVMLYLFTIVLLIKLFIFIYNKVFIFY